MTRGLLHIVTEVFWQVTRKLVELQVLPKKHVMQILPLSILNNISALKQLMLLFSYTEEDISYMFCIQKDQDEFLIIYVLTFLLSLNKWRWLPVVHSRPIRSRRSCVQSLHASIGLVSEMQNTRGQCCCTNDKAVVLTQQRFTAS